jgi:hypothetical protein
MAWLHIQHPVTDLETWCTAFGRFDEVRRGAGVLSEYVRQPPGDDAWVVVDLEFGTVEEAERFLHFLQTEVWTKPELSPALAGTPQAKILESVTLP